jgi:hypothetical protein
VSLFTTKFQQFSNLKEKMKVYDTIWDPHHFKADRDAAFHFKVDHSPNQSDANLRPLVYRTSRAPF